MIFTYWTHPEGNEAEALRPASAEIWTARFPRYRLFSDVDVLPLFAEYGDVYRELFQTIRLPACKSDIARLMLLRAHGGLYVDSHVGPGNADKIAELFARLATRELVIFDKPWEHTEKSNLSLMNTVMCARQGSEILAHLIKSGLRNLHRHALREKATSDYVPYNIFAMTGAWDISVVLFDRTKIPVKIKPEFADRVHIEELQREPNDPGFFLYKHYGYRQPGQHWSERQKSERLFGDIVSLELADPTLEDPFAALSRAETLFQSGQHQAAFTALLPARTQIPDNYWVNLLLGRIYAAVGQTKLMEECWRRAIASNDPSRMGAIFELVRYNLSRGLAKDVELLDPALLLCEGNDQKIWYFSQLLLLKGFVTLASGDVAKAEELIRRAYEFRPYFGDELAFSFPWVRDLLTKAASDRCPHLEYLRQRFTALQTPIDYKSELQRMPDECSVVEIGAMDGVKFDELHEPIVRKKWNAVVVEPLPDMFDALSRTYKDYPNVRCVNVAITETSGPVKMYRITPEAAKKSGHADWVTGLSSISKSFLLKMYGESVTEEIVQGLTFADFATQYRLTHIDVLQIDTEGYDLAVLRQIDLSRWKIPLIHIEIMHLQPPDRLEVFKILAAQGYRYSFDGSDITAVRPT